MHDDLMQLFRARPGHFVFESGHHGDVWLDLELLCLQPGRVEPFAAALADRLSEYHLDAVCGPLVEGAFVAMMVAKELNVEFFYTERREHPEQDGLYPVAYCLPPVLRRRIHGKQVAIVNDVINAGSAVRGTFAALEAGNANTVAMASLLTLGDLPQTVADECGIDLITLGSQPISIRTPEECPMCAAGRPLDNA